MPKKKAKNIQVVDEVLQVECECPYCGFINYPVLWFGAKKKAEGCYNCEKIFIVEIP